MFKRLIIIAVGAGFASFCIVTAFLTFFGKNPATLHLTRFFLIGYAAINAVLTPFGISGIIGGFSRKKALIRAFVTFQWWLATFVLIGLNVFNIILSKRGKGDFIQRCQDDFAKSQPDLDFLDRCTAIADDAEKATFIAACSIGGIMLLLGVLLLIVGIREYGSISSDEKNVLEKINLNNDNMDKIENLLSSKISNNNINNGGTIADSYDLGRYPPVNVTNAKLQPTNSIKTTTATANVDLKRHLINENTINSGQYSSLRRHPTDARDQTFIPQSYTGLTRNPTVPGLARYPPNGPVNVTRKPTIGNAYPPRNYIGAPQPTYPMAPQRSLSTKQYVNSQPPPPSYVTQFVIPPPKPTLMNVTPISPISPISPVSEVSEYSDYKSDYSDYNDDYDDYVHKPYNSPTKNVTTAPYLTRMRVNQI